MIKKNLILSLSILLFLIIQVYCNHATNDYIIRNVEIDRSPKNILVGSFVGGRSHLKPMLDLTEILIERGHNVTLLTSGYYTPSSEYPTVKQITLGPTMDLRNFNEISVYGEFDYKVLAKTTKIAIDSYKSNFEKYLNVTKEHNFDLFLCDFILNDVCIDVANILKKPVVRFGSFAQMVSPVSHKSDPMFGCNVSLENESILERIRCNIIQPLRMQYLIYPVMNQLNNIKKQIHAEHGIINTGNNIPKVTLTLLDNFFGFELPQSLPPNVQEIGPVLSNEFPALTPELSDFINDHERVLYIAFGGRFFTTMENNCKLLQSSLEAINKNLIDGVIWPLASTKKNEFCSTLNLSDGSQVQTLSILNNEHPHIHILDFAPQFAILNHNNTKLFLSHGGTGSVFESLYTGTPMLILPLGADQRGNAAKLKSQGVSLTLDKFDLNVDDILNKMDFLLKDENVKNSSKRMEVLAKINSKRKYRAADSIEYILCSSSFDNNKEVLLNEWVPADVRMGYIRKNDLDIYGILLGVTLGIFVGISWFTLKLFMFIVKKIPSSVNQKSKNE